MELPAVRRALVLVALMLASPAAAERLAFTLIPTVGLGGYHPSSTAASTGLLTDLTLRVVDHGPCSGRYERLEYGVTSGNWSSAFESVKLWDAEVLAFYGGSPLLPFDHQLFYGAGAGASEVDRGGGVLTRKPLAVFLAGISVPAGDWAVEARVKLICGTHDELFDVSGTAITLSASTMLEITP